MDIPIIKLPIDLPQLRAFRQLREILGDFSRALSVWYVLYQDLAYRAQDGQPVGHIPCAQEGEFLKSLEAVDADADARLRMFEGLKSALLLQRDGDNWVCHRFVEAHAGGELTQQHVSRLGGNMRSYHSKQKKLPGAAYKQALLILPDKFKDEHGELLSPDMVDRITRLIITCDNALFKPERPPAGYTEALIQDALAIVRKCSDEQSQYVCHNVALHRNHPRLSGMITEKLLPIFSGIVQELVPK